MLTKYYFVNDFKELIRVTDAINDIYTKQFPNSKQSDRIENRQRLCNKYAKITEKIIAGIMTFYGIIIFCDIVQPFVLYLLTGEVIQTMGIEFLAINKSTTVGAAILLCIEDLAFLGVYLLVFVFDSIVVSNFVNLSLVSDIIISHIHDLENDLLNTSCNDRIVKRKLVDIMLMQQKYDS